MIEERPESRRRMARRTACTCAIMALSLTRAASAQEHPWVHPAGHAVALFTQVQGIPGGGSLGEARVVQPLLMLDAGVLRNRLLFRASLDLEGWTMRNGELSPGSWGEGFVDRRHPHTYVHELVVTWYDLLRGLDGSARTALTVGKGFVPFGSDDPMSRPVLRFPINHHLAQILERAMVVAGVRAGPVEVEAAVFNGDEPERPGQWPKLDRLGDSWSARLTLRPIPAVEWQLSRAKVASPEHREGAGTPNHKWSTAVRVERPLAGTRLYTLAEWARTSEVGGLFVFNSVLAETAVTVGRHRPYIRVERTERPEEMRTLDLFRSARPHLDNSILGTTRWSVYTAGYLFLVAGHTRRIELQPFAEASYGRIAARGGGVFVPSALYGRDTFWSASLGVRAGWGMMGHRMGRYGVVTTTAHAETMQ
jgi:hypothetical protein